MLRQSVWRKVIFCCEVMWTMYLFVGIFQFCILKWYIEEVDQIYKEEACHIWLNVLVSDNSISFYLSIFDNFLDCCNL